MENIKRNLEKEGAYINRFWSGVITNRSPLFVPLSQMGIQILSRLDTLFDGRNTEISPRFTLVRRAGLSPFSAVQLGTGEIPTTFYGFRNLEGTVYSLADVTSSVSWITPTSQSIVFPKLTSTMSSIQKVASMAYGADGTSAWKWDGLVNLIWMSHGGYALSPWNVSPTTTITDNNVVDPNGDTTASTLVGAPTDNWVAQNVPNTAGTLSQLNETINWSVWLKVPSSTLGVKIFVFDGNNVLHASSALNVTTTWQRFVLTFTNTPGTHAFIAQIGGQNTVGSGKTLHIWGAQLEVSNVATDYQVTPNGPHGTNKLGIASPVTSPILSYVANGQLSPTVGYSYVICYVNSTTAQPSTASPISANTGPIANQTVTEGSVAVPITATSFDAANNATITCKNNFKPGQKVGILGLTFATWLNGATLTVTSATSTSFVGTGVSHVSYASHSDAGTATMTLSVPNSPFQYTVVHGGTFVSDGSAVYSANSIPLTKVASAPAVGQYTVSAAGVYTFAAADVNAGITITYTFSLAISTAINIQVQGIGSLDPQVDMIQIYRTEDGGSIYYLVATIGNTPNWTYTDSTLDSALNTAIIAPVDHSNDPAPAGVAHIVWYAGRLWAAAGNKLYFSAGPDATNGVGQECWPPANVFPVPGNITALAATSQGLVVNTDDDAYVVYGQDTASFTVPQLWQKNFGVANQNCVAQDGDVLFFFTTKRQLFQLSGNLNDIGSAIQPQLGLVVPANASITLHRNGTDEGLFISDGSTNCHRFSLNMSCWSPVAQPVGGIGVIKSIETSAGTWSLLAGAPTDQKPVYFRDNTTFTDNGTAYPAWAVVGPLILAPPRQVAILNSVLIEATRSGTYPKVGILLNEISGTFADLPQFVPDPPQLPDAQTLWMRRHDLKGSATPLAQHVRHCQVKIDFGTDDVQNELLGLGLV